MEGSLNRHDFDSSGKGNLKKDNNINVDEGTYLTFTLYTFVYIDSAYIH